MDRCLQQRSGILAADLRVILIHLQPVFHGLRIITGHGSIPHLIEAAHPAKGVGPGHIVAVGPDIAPLAGGIRPAMKIAVFRLDVLHLLRGGSIAHTFINRQFQR